MNAIRGFSAPLTGLRLPGYPAKMSYRQKKNELSPKAGEASVLFESDSFNCRR
jgi:hypothetical protein